MHIGSPGKETRLRATIGWKHAFKDVDSRNTMAFAGGQDFTVSGTALSRNGALLGAEAHMALSRTSAVTLGLNTEFATHQREHAAYVKLHWAY